MDAHNKLTLQHLAWFNENVAREHDLTPVDYSAFKPDELILVSYKSENFREAHSKGDTLTVNDVMHEKDIITYKEWKDNGDLRP